MWEKLRSKNPKNDMINKPGTTDGCWVYRFLPNSQTLPCLLVNLLKGVGSPDVTRHLNQISVAALELTETVWWSIAEHFGASFLSDFAIFRCHLFVEDLMKEGNFCDFVKDMMKKTNRGKVY
jgi:hypothetical protein